MREPKPYYRKKRNCWYVQIKGTEYKLGSDKETAWEEYHRLMAGHRRVASKATVAELVEQFLTWIKDRRKPGTYEWYRGHLESFARYCGRLRIANLKLQHVEGWLEVHGVNSTRVTTGKRKGRRTKNTGKANSNTYKNGGCRAVARAFNWAVKRDLLSASPIANMERPAATRRDEYVTLNQWKEILPLADGPFRDILEFLWETGCRPYEARMARADNFDAENRQIVLDLRDSKGAKYQRVIMLNTRAYEIVSRLASEGPIFKHGRGKGWAARSLECRFRTLTKKVGYRVIPYMLRHSWITHALLRGVDPLTVGILAGHRDATMVMRVYGHIAHDRQHLAAKLRQATGEVAS